MRSSERPTCPATSATHRAHRVRRLSGHVDRELLARLVVARHAPARLDRRNVNARDVHVLRHREVGVGEHLLGCVLVARFPVPDVVRVLPVRSHERGARLHRLVRIDHRRQRIVLHIHHGDAVRGRITTRGDHRRDFLRLIDDAIRRQHHLGVAHERRHHVQVVLLEVTPRDHREHAGCRERARRVDAHDLRVRVRRADNVHVEHVGEHDVVDVVALPAQEAAIFLALDRMPHPTDFGSWYAAAVSWSVVFPRVEAAS